MRLTAPVLASLVLSALALAGCGPSAEEPVEAPAAPAPPPLLAGVNLAEPVRVRGAEPFWAVELSGKEMIFRGADRAEQRAPQPEAVVQGTVARLEAVGDAGVRLSVTLAATECSDGMSDRIYPLTAIVKVGEETLNGCALPAAAVTTAGDPGPATPPRETAPAN